MKNIFSLMVLLLLLSFRPLGKIYDIRLTTIDGNRIELSQYRGKKILFIVLPLSAQDTMVSISDIARLQTKYQNSLVIIGIPSEEAGYKMKEAGDLKQVYRASNANIVITEGMKVKKGIGQFPLFQWLTNKDMNHHFDCDTRGVGSKFFIDEEGDLYAVMGPNLALTNPLVDRIMARSSQKE